MGFALGAMAQAGLGLGPWAVFHQGIGRQVGLPLGTVTILVGVIVLLGWIPLNVRPGVGTLFNAVLVGAVTNIALVVIPAPQDLLGRVVMMLAGVLVHGGATAVYLSAGLGPGPRDGLMTGLHRHFGWSIARTRTMLEVIVFAAGFALGGTVGIGTLLYALGVGAIIQAVLLVVDREGNVTRSRGVESLADPAT
jgi:uncharacterized membrane protein YczE